jgi:hypothetical protein
MANDQTNQLRIALQKLMAKLADLLDEDQFAHCENIVCAAGVEPPKPIAMIEANDARRLADELEALRQSHWSHWSAEENHTVSVSVRHLRLLAQHSGSTVTHGVSLDRQKPLSPPATLGEME